MALPLYLSDEENNKILADYMETHNYSETGRRFKVSDDYVRRLVKKNEDIVRNRLEQKKEENIQSTLEYMETQHETKKRILDKLLKGIELKSEDIDNIDKMNIKDIATAYGIILDKELKVLELQRDKNGLDKELSKLDELLGEIRKDANN